jgi:hypothetical protein
VQIEPVVKAQEVADAIQVQKVRVQKLIENCYGLENKMIQNENLYKIKIGFLENEKEEMVFQHAKEKEESQKFLTDKVKQLKIYILLLHN